VTVLLQIFVGVPMKGFFKNQSLYLAKYEQVFGGMLLCGCQAG